MYSSIPSNIWLKNEGKLDSMTRFALKEILKEVLQLVGI